METSYIDIALLIETFLLKGLLFINWTQYHNFATIRGDAQRGHGGLSFLVCPDFPYHMRFIPHHFQDQITITVGTTLTILGFYLPPTTMPFPVYQSFLQSVDFNPNSSVICLGDLNTRLGDFTGDTRFFPQRGNFFIGYLLIQLLYGTAFYYQVLTQLMKVIQAPAQSTILFPKPIFLNHILN